MRHNRNGMKHLFSDIVIFTAGMVLAKIVQFLLMPLYTSYLTLEAYGAAELVNNLSELFLPVMSLCIYDSVLRYTIEDQDNRDVIISSALQILLVSVVVALPVTWVVKNVFHYKYAAELFLIVCFYSLQRILSCFIRGKDYSKVFALNGVVSTLALASFSILFLVIFDFGVRGYLWAIWLSYFTASVYLFTAGKVYRDFSFKTGDFHMGKKLIGFSLPLIPYNIMYFFTTLVGRYILVWYSDEATVGMYIAAIKITAVVNLMQQAVSVAIQLNLSKAYKNEGKEDYYSYILNLFAMLFIAVGSGIICISPVLSKIVLQKEFYHARIYIPVLIFSAILNCISSMFGTMYQTCKQTKRTVPIIAVGVTINILCCFLLIPRFGIWGVCFASVLSYFSQVIYKMTDINRFCKITYRWKSVLVLMLFLVLQTALMMGDKWINRFLVWVVMGAEVCVLVCSYRKEILSLIRREK